MKTISKLMIAVTAMASTDLIGTLPLQAGESVEHRIQELNSRGTSRESGVEKSVTSNRPDAEKIAREFRQQRRGDEFFFSQNRRCSTIQKTNKSA